MIHWRPPYSVRTRLTLLYVAVLAATLILFSAFTSTYLLWHLRDQLTHFAIQDVETVEGLLFFDAQGHLQLREDYHNHPESKQVQERLLEVLSPGGQVLYRNSRLGHQELGGTPFAGEGEGGYSPRSARLADGTRLRLVSRQHTVDGHPTLIRLAYSEESIWKQFEELLGALMLALPALLALAGLAGYGLARRALIPLEAMTRQAERITSEQLHERLPVHNPDDEFGRLAAVFNTMLARLERSFDQLRRFTADASHELRTPLASIRSVGEAGLGQNSQSSAAYRDVIGSMLEEVGRLTELVDSLLLVSRADAGQVPVHPTAFPASELIDEAVALFEALAEERGQQLALAAEPLAMVYADRVLIRQALLNILHNAIKYTPPGGSISVRGQSTAGGMVSVQVTDTGPGIPPGDCAKVFDRFYRVDAARSRAAGGVGLGLAIAKWAVEANGGQISVSSTSGEGTTFTMELPQVAPLTDAG